MSKKYFKTLIKNLKYNKKDLFDMMSDMFKEIPEDSDSYPTISTQLCILEEEINDIDYLEGRDFDKTALTEILNHTTCGVIAYGVKMLLEAHND